MSTASNTFENMASLIEDLASDLQSAVDESNQSVDEFNELFDTHADLLDSYKNAIAKIEQMQSAHRMDLAKLKELERLNPKKLVQTNKMLKAKNEDLTKRLAASEQTRKKALKQHKEMLSMKQDHGVLDTWADPKTGECLRVVTTQVAKSNTFGGIPETPVIEYFHRASGITRQGVLNTEGGMSWGALPDSLPPDQISTLAKSLIIDFCNKHKIKLNKEVKNAI